MALVCTRGGIDGAQLLRAAQPSTALLVQAVHFLLYNVLIGSPAGQPRKGHLDRLLAQSLSGNGELLARFHDQAVAPWLLVMEELLRLAQQAGDLYPSGEAQLTVWFTYQLGLAARLLENCPTQPVAYPARGLALLDSLVGFALRGLGLTEAALRRPYRPAELLAETRRLLGLPTALPLTAKESAHGAVSPAAYGSVAMTAP